MENIEEKSDDLLPQMTDLNRSVNHKSNSVYTSKPRFNWHIPPSKQCTVLPVAPPPLDLELETHADPERIDQDNQISSTTQPAECSRDPPMVPPSPVESTPSIAQEPTSSNQPLKVSDDWTSSDSSSSDSSDDESTRTGRRPGKIIVNLYGVPMPRQLMMKCRVLLARLNIPIPVYLLESSDSEFTPSGSSDSESDAPVDTTPRVSGPLSKRGAERPTAFKKIKSARAIELDKVHQLPLAELIRQCQGCRVVITDYLSADEKANLSLISSNLSDYRSESIRSASDSESTTNRDTLKRHKKKKKKHKHKKSRVVISDDDEESLMEKPSRTKFGKRARSDRKRVKVEPDSDDEETDRKRVKTRWSGGVHDYESALSADEKMQQRIDKVRQLAAKIGMKSEPEEVKSSPKPARSSPASKYVSPWSEAIATAGLPKIPKIPKKTPESERTVDPRMTLDPRRNVNPYERIYNREQRRREFEKMASQRYGPNRGGPTGPLNPVGQFNHAGPFNPAGPPISAGPYGRQYNESFKVPEHSTPRSQATPSSASGVSPITPTYAGPSHGRALLSTPPHSEETQRAPRPVDPPQAVPPPVIPGDRSTTSLYQPVFTSDMMIPDAMVPSFPQNNPPRPLEVAPRPLEIPLSRPDIINPPEPTVEKPKTLLPDPTTLFGDTDSLLPDPSMLATENFAKPEIPIKKTLLPDPKLRPELRHESKLRPESKKALLGEPPSLLGKAPLLPEPETRDNTSSNRYEPGKEDIDRDKRESERNRPEGDRHRRESDRDSDRSRRDRRGGDRDSDRNRQQGDRNKRQGDRDRREGDRDRHPTDRDSRQGDRNRHGGDQNVSESPDPLLSWMLDKQEEFKDILDDNDWRIISEPLGDTLKKSPTESRFQDRSDYSRHSSSHKHKRSNREHSRSHKDRKKSSKEGEKPGPNPAVIDQIAQLSLEISRRLAEQTAATGTPDSDPPPLPSDGESDPPPLPSDDLAPPLPAPESQPPEPEPMPLLIPPPMPPDYRKERVVEEPSVEPQEAEEEFCGEEEIDENTEEFEQHQQYEEGQYVEEGEQYDEEQYEELEEYQSLPTHEEQSHEQDDSQDGHPDEASFRPPRHAATKESQYEEVDFEEGECRDTPPCKDPPHLEYDERYPDEYTREPDPRREYEEYYNELAASRLTVPASRTRAFDDDLYSRHDDADYDELRYPRVAERATPRRLGSSRGDHLPVELARVHPEDFDDLRDQLRRRREVEYTQQTREEEYYREVPATPISYREDDSQALPAPHLDAYGRPLPRRDSLGYRRSNYSSDYAGRRDEYPELDPYQPAAPEPVIHDRYGLPIATSDEEESQAGEVQTPASDSTQPSETTESTPYKTRTQNPHSEIYRSQKKQNLNAQDNHANSLAILNTQISTSKMPKASLRIPRDKTASDELQQDQTSATKLLPDGLSTIGNDLLAHHVPSTKPNKSAKPSLSHRENRFQTKITPPSAKPSSGTSIEFQRKPNPNHSKSHERLSADNFSENSRSSAPDSKLNFSDKFAVKSEGTINYVKPGEHFTTKRQTPLIDLTSPAKPSVKSRNSIDSSETSTQHRVSRRGDFFSSIGSWSDAGIPGLDVMVEDEEDVKYPHPMTVSQLIQALTNEIRIILDCQSADSVLKALVRIILLSMTEETVFQYLRIVNPQISDLSSIFNKALINLMQLDDIFRLITAAGLIRSNASLTIHPQVKEALLVTNLKLRVSKNIKRPRSE